MGNLLAKLGQKSILWQVLILENASAGMALEGWSCERLAQEFPDAKMRREYDWVKNPQAGGEWQR